MDWHQCIHKLTEILFKILFVHTYVNFLGWEQMAFYLINKEMANKLKITAVEHVSPVEDFIFLVFHERVLCPWVYCKAFACNVGDLDSILGGEDPLEKGMGTHSSILAWRIPWTEEPGGLQFMGLARGRQGWATNNFFFMCEFPFKLRL